MNTAAASSEQHAPYWRDDVEAIKGRLLDLSNMLKLCTLVATHAAPEPLADMLEYIQTELGHQYARLDEAAVDTERGRLA